MNALKEHLFDSLAEARQIIEVWRLDYNCARPHSSLGTLTPSEFAKLQGDGPPESSESLRGALFWKPGAANSARETETYLIRRRRYAGIQNRGDLKSQSFQPCSQQMRNSLDS
jgi:hypothetical protein